MSSFSLVPRTQAVRRYAQQEAVGERRARAVRGARRHRGVHGAAGCAGAEQGLRLRHLRVQAGGYCCYQGTTADPESESIRRNLFFCS